MKVKELTEKLKDYNQDAEVVVTAHCRDEEFSLCFGGGDGGAKNTASTVSFYVDSLCGSESQEV